MSIERFEGKILTDASFSLPTFEDFYNTAIDTPGGSKQETVFYIETPPGGEDFFGFSNELEMVSFKASKDAFFLDDNLIEINAIDGDTVTIDLNKLEYPTNANIKAYIDGLTSGGENNNQLYDKDGNIVDLKSKIGSLRLLFLDAPELPHFSLSTVQSKDIVEIKYSEAKTRGYICLKVDPDTVNTDPQEYNNDSILKFIKIGTSFRQILKTEKNLNGTTVYKILAGDESNVKSIKDGYRAKNELINKINQASDIRICISTNALNHKAYGDKYAELYPTYYQSKDWFELLKKEFNTVLNSIFNERWYSVTGYNMYGLEMYRRILSVIYLKIDGQWINLNKFIIQTTCENTSVNKIENTTPAKYMIDNANTAIFKPYTYDYRAKIYIDKFYEDSNAGEENRIKTQIDVFAQNGQAINKEKLNKWTVSIGDVSFFVPPISIRSVTQTTSTRVPMMRTKGSATKNADKTQIMVELDLYFCNSNGINGLPYTTKLYPESNTDITYHMNGLRALIAHFKFLPFLPVTNKYINETLNIDAVSLESLKISTVPGFPKLIKASLLMKKFDYRIFMPQIPDSPIEEDYWNPFSRCINYDVMRYYYQKPLILGNKLASEINSKTLDINSTDFYKKTLFSNRTALMPCKFLDTKASIYIANEDHLRKLLSIKYDAIRKSKGVASSFVPTETQKKLIADISNIFERLNISTIKAKYDMLINDAVNPVINSGADYFEIADTAKNIVVSKVLPQLKIELEKNINDVVDINNNKIVNSIDITSDGISISIHTNCGMADAKDLIMEYAADRKIVNIDTSEVFKDFCLFIGIGNLYPDENEKFDKSHILCDKESGKYSIDFAYWCNVYKQSYLIPNEEANNIKQDIDLENLNTLKYDLAEDNILVTGFSAALKNNYSNMTLSGSDGTACQFLGGQDTIVSFVVETKNEGVVALLRSLPELTAYYVRTYRKVLPAFPIKIDSEFTRMLGVQEITIDNVVANTVEGFPGLYRININAISVDRTIRNKEALKAIDMEDEGAAEGKIRDGINVLKYDKIGNLLMNAELYPDLELPKIKELGEKGFRFIKYRNKERQKEELFVDPDFYFLYPEVVFSEIVKSAVLGNTPDDFKKNQENSAVKYTDLENAKAQTDGTGQIVKNSLNKKANEQLENINIIKSNIDKAVAYNKKKSLEDIMLTNAVIMGDTSYWKIAPEIKCCFLEKYYVKELNKTNNEDEEEKAKIINSLSRSKEAKEKIFEYLKTTEINKYADLYNPENLNDTTNLWSLYKRANENTLNESDCETIVDRILDTPLVAEAIQLLGTDENGSGQFSMVTGIKKMLFGALCALSGDYEYDPEIAKSKWYPNLKLYGIAAVDGIQTMCDEDLLTNADKLGINNLTEFGVSRIKSYTKESIQNVLSSKEIEELIEKIKNQEVISERLALDPKYRYNSTVYFINCARNYKFAAEAFVRLMLYWLARLIDMNVLPSMVYDVMRSNARNKVVADRKAKQMLIDAGEEVGISDDDDIRKSLERFLYNNSGDIDCGKFFIATLFAMLKEPLTDGVIWQMIQNRDYAGLNEFAASAISMRGKIRKTPTEEKGCISRLISALYGLGFISEKQSTGKITDITPTNKYITNINEKVCLEAAKDPAQYIMHSMYDMMTNDYRGRMLRAFPTFYVLFMDEGREVGLWKLHDNFYNINSIYEIQIVKSRKIAADTAILTISNLYQTFTTDDEDGYINYKGSLSDLWDSVWHEEKFFEINEKKRLIANKVNRAKLSPGIRIAIKIGYGSNAKEIPGAFNGVIAEVETGEMVNIVAQGDGIELMNPLFDNIKSDEIQLKDKAFGWWDRYFTRGATPKKILESILTTKNGFISKMIQENVDSINTNPNIINAAAKYLTNANPYGIYHFGSSTLKDIFSAGEICQNLYEISDTPMFNDVNLDLTLKSRDADVGNSPYISFDPFNKTVWEIMHICKSVAPDYYVGIVPFGFRSSIYFGKPHFYYAYDYVKHDDVLVEKRKPYQQWHYYYSDCDIIKNGIYASDKKVKTNAIGLFTLEGSGDPVSTQTSKIWVDQEIYPENQKGIIVDTKLYGKAKTFFDANENSSLPKQIISFATGIIDVKEISNIWMGSIFNRGEQGRTADNERVARLATLNALKESIKEMYQGELIVIGDPSVKPNDRMFIYDTYENMNGSCLVREVIHTLSPRTGFTTTVTPDCIAAADTKDEKIIQNMGAIVGKKITHAALAYGLYSIYGTVFVKAGEKAKYVKKAGNALLNKLTGLEKAEEFKNALLNKNGIKLLQSIKNSTLGKIPSSLSNIISRIPVKYAGNAITAIASYIIVDLCAGTLANFIRDEIGNSKTLTIFPIQKDGIVMTAGLEGNKGSVYGSPTYNDISWLQALYVKWFNYEEDDKSFIYWFDSLITGGEIKEAVSKFVRDGDKIFEIGDSNNTEAESEIAISSLGNTLMDNIHLKDNSYSLSIVGRMIKDNILNNATMMKSSLDAYTIKTVNDIVSTSAMRNQNMISRHPALAHYIESNVLNIANDNIDDPTLIKEYCIPIEDEDIKFNAIKITLDNGKEALDIPFLCSDALIVLKDIVDGTISKCRLKNITDKVSMKNELKSSALTIKSALIVGGEDVIAASGHRFILSTTGKFQQYTYNYIEELHMEIKRSLSRVPVFNYKKINETDIEITINPRTPIANTKINELDVEKEDNE